MKKFGFGFFLIGGVSILLSNSVFAATVSQTEIRNFSTKLENHKAKLLRDINDSKNKLKSVTKEAKSFSDTQIFKAASCLGAIPEQDQNLDFDTITTKLKADILNEYIKLDGEIKRLGFGLEEQDPILFGNKLDTFYNQNAIKINALENEYYLKTGKVKKSFLEYLENNKELLNKLAQEMDMITNLQNIASGATAALETFKKEANLRSNFLKNLESLKAGYESKFVNDLETAFNQAIFKNHPSDDIQAKYLIHKDNFLKKFKAEMTKAQYHIFSSFFSYTDYETLVEKKKELEKRFLTVSGSIDCQQLLATNFGISTYVEGWKTKGEEIKNAFELLTKAVKSNKLQLQHLEESVLALFAKEATTLTTDILKNFRMMLDAEIPQKIVTPEPAPTTPKITFTQAFKKGEYHEQIKALQSLLKKRGYYKGEIDGVYSATTIEAVYQFQLKEGIVTGKEKNHAGHGRFGTRTRAKINSIQ